VAKGTLYNHFRSKEELARVLLRSELDRLADAVAGRPLDVSLSLLADELGRHPVLRRILADEPEVALRLLAVFPDRWTELTGRLATALGIDESAAQLAGRWLLGTALQPGSARVRDRQAVALATVLVTAEWTAE
jgi:AcrR family transcriptional regulator